MSLADLQINWGGEGFPEYQGYLTKGKKSGQEQLGQQQTTQALANQNQDQSTAMGDVNAAQGTYSQFEGPVQNSPFYKSLLTTGIQDTSRAYDTARSNMAQRANAAGFGYNQPVAQGAQNQLQSQEASALANVPQQAMLGAAPLSLQAAQGSGQLGLGLGNQALGWGNLGRGWNQDVYNMDKQRGGFDWSGAAQGALQGAMMAAMA